jgi:streptogramin lyase
VGTVLRRAWVAWLVVLGGVACDAAAPCVDTDDDGYGPGCEAGEDCDPNNAIRNVDCERVPPPDCEADRNAVGCPCLANAFATCLEELNGIGACRAGRARCVNGFWGVCEGGVGPLFEICDGVDQDCDGIVDDGALSPCGGCNPLCTGDVWGEGPAPFEPTSELELTRLGELTLARVEQTFPTVWVANSAEGTLSRIDAERAIETARYSTGGAEPSRVAVDWAGDVWVTNRAFGEVSSVVKIAGSLERCVDRDGDGPETSTGPTDVRGLADECVLLHVPVGGPGGVARALAIDGDRGLDGISGGDAWVGLHDEEAVVELDGLTGEVLRRIELPGFQPYSETFDRWGTLWMISRDGYLARIDPRTSEATLLEVPLPCYLLYGVAADADGRLLLTGFSCDRLVSYDPAIERWETRTAPPSPRGVVFDVRRDRFWVAHTAAGLSEARIGPLRVERELSMANASVTPIETIGVAVDALGQVWTASSRGGPGGVGVATRIDPDRGEVTAQVPVGASPHVQGDLAGARVRSTLVRRGSATHVFRGCGPGVETTWLRLHVDAVLGSGGRVGLEARHAEDEAGLARAVFEPLGTLPDDAAPFALTFPEGGAVEVRLTLEVDGEVGAPRVRRVGLEWRCPGPD